MIEKNKSGEYWSYAYDHRGQLLTASKASTHHGTVTDEVEYTYDAFGNRLTREVTVGTTSLVKYVVDGLDTAKPDPLGIEHFDVVLELDGSNAVTVRRVFGAGFDDVVARQAEGGALSWYGTDRQGTVRQMREQ